MNISTTQTLNRAQTSPEPFGWRQPPDPFGGQDPFSEFWRRFFGEQFEFGWPAEPRVLPRTALGSGVIMDAKGLILTNHHVVENAEKITVKLSDEREFSAKVTGRDPKADIAGDTDHCGEGKVPGGENLLFLIRRERIRCS